MQNSNDSLNSQKTKQINKQFNVPTEIKIRGAKLHNLKNIDVDVPLNKFVSIVGVSGSGKSSLAMGILYAEGSRRYLNALSTYTRRRISQPKEANVDSIEYLPSAIALHQRPATPDIRSTFGTMTELLNVIRLMFSRLGSHCCPNGHYTEPTANVARDKQIMCHECHESFWPMGAEDFAFNSDGACQKCSGTGIVREIDISKIVPNENKTLQEGAVASWNQTGIWWMSLVAKELGVRIDVPFKNLTKEEKDIIFYGEECKKMVAIPSKTGQLFDLNCTYTNAIKAIENGLKKATCEDKLLKINQFLKTEICPICHGNRLSAKANSTLLCGKRLAEVSAMTLAEVCDFVEKLPDNFQQQTLIEIAKSLKKQFMLTAKRLLDFGLEYITLDRAGSTLSTGERQRVQLARVVRTQTTGVLYVLDEPSIGLHPLNTKGLIGVIYDLISHGNSVVMVDHDINMIKQAEYIVEIGKGAGINGGNIIANGTVKDVESNKNSVIAPYLNGTENTVVRKQSSSQEMFKFGKIHLETGKIYTLREINIDIPVGRLTVITGVSGSGKTTTILESLVPAIQALNTKQPLPKHVKKIVSNEINNVHLIDATPVGANIRSTIATYSGIMDNLRKIFASTDEAQKLKLKFNDFSYNTGKLRCEECDGTGQITMDVQFLPDIDVVCPKCNGGRYNKQTETILSTFPDGKQYSMIDIMSFTINQVIEKTNICNSKNLTDLHVDDFKKLNEKLVKLQHLGVGYLTIGEGTTLLSGGEAQRLKLSTEIGKSQKGILFVFDEPTIGLHPKDVKQLVGVFDDLVNSGATIVVIEHDLDMIANADYIIDIGLDECRHGGYVLATGTPNEIKTNKRSEIGRFL